MFVDIVVVQASWHLLERWHGHVVFCERNATALTGAVLIAAVTERDAEAALIGEMMLRYAHLMLVFSGACLWTIACDRGGPPSESTAQASATEKASGVHTPTTTASNPALESAPRRIVAIAPNATEIIIALGEVDRLVGVSHFCRLPDGVHTVARVGGILDPNLELILRLKPDLIITRGRMRDVEQLCRMNGIAHYRDPTEGYDDIFRTIRELGDRLRRRDAADALVRETTGRIDGITRRIAGRPRPRVLFTTDRPIDSLARLTTCGKGTFVDDTIRRAGGENIFADVDVAYPEVNLEAVLSARPDVIIEVMPGVKDASGDAAQRIIAQWEPFGDVPAVASRRVHVFTDADLVIPSPRIADSIARLAAILHPEVSFE